MTDIKKKRRKPQPRMYIIETFRRWPFDKQGADLSTYTVAAMNRRGALSAVRIRNMETVISIRCIGNMMSKHKIWKERND